MKNKLIALVMLVLFISLCLLVACSASSETSRANEQRLDPISLTSDENSHEVTLTWTMWDELLIPYYHALIEAYKEIAPHVTIDLIDLGTAEYENILQMHLMSGVEYDIVKVRSMPSYVNKIEANLLMPLDDLIAHTDLNLADFDGFTDILRPKDGLLYTVPIRRDHWVIFYNKDIFDEAGIEYPTNEMRVSDFDALVREVGAATNDGIWGNIYHWWPSTVHVFGLLGTNTLADGVYDWQIPYYEMVLAHQRAGYAPSYVDLTIGNTHYSVLWYSSEGAMLNMGTWFIAMQLNAYREGTSTVSNWGIVSYPVPNDAQLGASAAVFTGLSIGRNSNHSEEAMDFLAFASGPTGAKIMVEVGQMPAMMTDEVVDSIVALDGFPQDANSRAALSPTSLRLEMPMNPLAAEINAIIAATHTEIMVANITIIEGINAMNRQIGDELGINFNNTEE